LQTHSENNRTLLLRSLVLDFECISTCRTYNHLYRNQTKPARKYTQTHSFNCL